MNNKDTQHFKGINYIASYILNSIAAVQIDHIAT